MPCKDCGGALVELAEKLRRVCSPCQDMRDLRSSQKSEGRVSQQEETLWEIFRKWFSKKDVDDLSKRKKKK